MMGATRRGRTLVFNAARKAWSQFCRFLAGLMIGGHTLVFNAARKALTTVLTVPLPCYPSAARMTGARGQPRTATPRCAPWPDSQPVPPGRPPVPPFSLDLLPAAL